MMQVLPTYGTARSWIDTANSCFIQWGHFALSASVGSTQTVAFPLSIKNLLFVAPIPSNAVDQQIGFGRWTSQSILISKGNTDHVPRDGVWFAVCL